MAGKAIVTYFHHSGFTVAVEKTLLVFDYWRGENGELTEQAQLHPRDFEGWDQILVFVSHDHEDHFDEVIYTWDYEHLPITYIVADDLPIGKRGKRMKPGDEMTVGDTRIRAFDSTDKGVSFYVTVGDMHIFHAGDLNLWHWREESTLREIAQAEKDYYAAVAPIEGLPIDICMFPVDPRMGGMYDAGANHFVMAVKPRLFIPMHWQNRPEVAESYARKGRTKYTEVLPLTEPRQQAELTFDEFELRIRVVSALPRAEEEAPAEAPRDVNLDALNTADPFADTDLPVQLQ